MEILSRVRRWPLLGRDSQLDAMTDALRDRRIGGFTIYGPAGVGKTRLGEEFLERAAEGGFSKAWVTATSAARIVPLGAIAHLLPAGVRLSDPAAAFAAAAKALTRGNKSRILMVDDLHLLDDTSAVILGQLVESGQIRLVGTVRSGEPVTETVKSLQWGERIQQVPLEGLIEETVDSLLQVVLGGRVSQRTIQELYEISQGNVLYLRELVEGALASNTLVSDGEVWELTRGAFSGTLRLSELISARLSAVGPQGKPVLDLLSLCDSVSWADAEAVSSPGTLEIIEASGAVQVARQGHRTVVTMAHPLYVEVIRADLPVLTRRKALLEQAQRVIEYGARRRDDPLHIATWQLAASGSADPELLVQAATLARHAHDYPQVVSLLEAVPADHQSTATRIMHGEVLFELGMPDDAEEILARAQASAAGEQEKLASALVRTFNLFWGCCLPTRALAVNREAVKEMASPAAQRVLSLNEGSMLAMSGDPVGGLSLLEDLDDEIDQEPSVQIWLVGIIAKTAGLAFTGRTTEAIELAARAYEAHRAFDMKALVPHPGTQRNSLILALPQAGRIREAREIGEKAYSDLVKARAGAPLAWIAYHIGRTEMLAGHPLTARRWFAESAAEALKSHPAARRPALQGLAACAAQLGDVGASETALTESARHRSNFHNGEEPLGEAWLLAARGHLAQAREVLARAAAEARASHHLVAEALLLTDMSRLGGAKQAATRLAKLAQLCDGALLALYAEFADALANHDIRQLWRLSESFERFGADLLAAEAATASLTASRSQGHRHHFAPAAMLRADTLTARCQGAQTPLLAATQETAALTPREREIAVLAAGGMASKDIAAHLDLSVRTVDNHLGRAYTKVGATNRRELATILTPPEER